MIDIKPLVILTGPTAVGKTDLSIQLAKEINGEIISADSMQVYKYMDIGSAKIMPDEMQDIPHHLIDERMPDEEFHVVKFKEMAMRYIEEIYSRHKIPIIVGGTGFYIQAILYDIDFTKENSDDEYRKNLEEIAECQGTLTLYNQLQEVDQAASAQIHPNNIKRVIRALEYHHLTGEKISEHNEVQKQKQSPFTYVYFVLNDHRERLYQRINERVDLMIANGLVDEVASLKDMGYHKHMVSMQGLGYKEILCYLEGEIALEKAIELIKRDTRHFAKRQITWFKRERDCLWINKPDFHYNNDRMLQHMKKEIGERLKSEK